jgi:uncharacterized protein
MSPRLLIAAAAPILALALAAAAPAEGPGFDCAKASTAVENAICATPDLARLDLEMAAAYRAAQTRSPTPVTLKAGQRAFLDSRGKDLDGKLENPINTAALADLYRARIETLNTEAARNRRAAAVALPVAQLKTRCADVAIRTCKVDEAGPVPGSEPYGGLFYQVQRPANEDEWERGVVVLRNDGGVLKVVLWNFEGDLPEAPMVVATIDGPLLLAPSTHGGTGRFNGELIFRPLPGGGWRDVDIDAWRADFDGRLPDGVGVWKGVLYDWPELTLETALWKTEDVNCCPTGGMAKAQLTLKGDQLALKSMDVDRTPPKE